jgi:GT2 family glycosyltransferase
MAIVIINWNKAQEVLHCVHTISSWNELKAEIIVVDNGSSPEEASLLLNSKFRFQLIINERNRGYTGGNNIGISKALAGGFSYIMLLNSDATISEHCLRQLLECISHSPELGVVGPLLDEGERNYAGGRNIGIHSMTRIRYNPQMSNSELINVDYVPGPFFLPEGRSLRKLACSSRNFFLVERLQTSARECS